MIDFRYHLVSLTAVLLALAVGVVLGAGPLRGGITEVLDSPDLAARADTLQVQRDAEAAAGAALDEALAELAEPLTVDALAGRTVLVVRLPGAAPTQVETLTAAVTGAGAEVTATMTLTDAWTDPDQAAFRAALAAQVDPLLEEAEAVPVADTDVAILAGALSVALVSGVEETSVPGGTVGTVLGVLSGGELAVLEPELPEPAGLVLVVAGDGVDDDAAQAWGEVLGSLAARGPVLLAGDVPPAAPSGEDGTQQAGGGDPGTRPLVLAVRDAVLQDPTAPSAAVSTLDHAGAAVGPAATVLALAGAAAGGGGNYGLLQSAEGPVPVRP